MMRTCIILFFLLVGTCSSPRETYKTNGAIVKYKYVDSKGNWLELGLEKGKKQYLIYLPKEYDTLYNVGDTLK